MFKGTTARALVGAGAVLAIIGVTGTVSTASNTMPAASVFRGYGSQSITGVIAESVTYDLDAPNETILTVTLVLTGDTTARTIETAFNDAAPGVCSDPGTYAVGTDDTTYVCNVADIDVALVTKFALVAS